MTRFIHKTIVAIAFSFLLTAMASAQPIECQLEHYRAHRSFVEPIYLRLSIKNLSDQKLTLQGPRGTGCVGWEYFTQDQGLGNLLFRELSPLAYGFGGPGDNRFDLEPMQQVDFYFHRSFPGLMEDNEYYWQQVSRGSSLDIRARYNLFLNLETTWFSHGR